MQQIERTVDHFAGTILHLRFRHPRPDRVEAGLFVFLLLEFDQLAVRCTFYGVERGMGALGKLFCHGGVSLHCQIDEID